LKTAVNLEFFVEDAARAAQRGDVVIVIDVLRCCSTIIAALANSAKGILPARTLKEARTLHNKCHGSVLAGERGGIKPRGFSLGNSPLEFTPEKVKGNYVILTTTSGTKAIVSSKNARWVLIGALINAKPVAEAASRIAEEENAGISLVLSGRRGHFFIEDFVCVGAVAESLQANNIERSDAVLAALHCFRQAKNCLERVVQSGHHATYLKSLGLVNDVKFCSQLDAFRIVPYLKGDVIVPLGGLARGGEEVES